MLYTVRRGMVKLVRDLADGTERVVRLLKAGDVAGLEVAIGSRYKHTAITLTETEVCRIPLSTLERLEVHSPHLAHQLMLRWQNAVDDADRALVEFSTGAAEARIAHLLLYLSSLNEDGTGIELSRHDMGSFLGITTETASRAMADLKATRPRNGVAGRGHFPLQPGVARPDVAVRASLAPSVGPGFRLRIRNYISICLCIMVSGYRSNSP